MAYENPPFVKSSTQEPNAANEGLYSVMRASVPRQDTAGTGHEASGSGNIFGNLQRATVQHWFDIRGTQPEVQINQILAHFHMGDPHPWMDKFTDGPYRSSYIIDIRVEGRGFGEVAGTDGYGQSWSRVIITYQQRPCPSKFEENVRGALVVRNEWYSRPDAQGIFDYLTGTQETVPVLIPVSIVSRYYPNVFLTVAKIKIIEDALGKLNPVTFRGRDPDVWVLDIAQLSPLFEKDPGSMDMDGNYEVTLVFRSDFERKHEWWWPKPDDVGRPIRPLTVAGTLTYEDIHNKRRLLNRASTPFEDLVPTNLEACTPIEG